MLRKVKIASKNVPGIKKRRENQNSPVVRYSQTKVGIANIHHNFVFTLKPIASSFN
jgi:hypothetical protein